MDSVTVLEAMSGTRYAEFASTRLLGPTGPQADLVDCATVSDVLFIPIGVNGPRRRRRLPLRRQQEHGRDTLHDLGEKVCSRPSVGNGLHCTYRPDAFPLRLPHEWSAEVQNGAGAPPSSL